MYGIDERGREVLEYLPGRVLDANIETPSVALLAAGITTAVEFFKLVRTPALDAFRRTPPGILLLGRFFSLWDIVAYVLAITLGALLDTSLRRWKLFC